MLGLVLAACPGPRTPVPTPSVRPESGGTLRVLAVSDIDSLDPNRAARPSSWFVARAVHRGLLAFPDAGFPSGARPVPDLARDLPTVSPDGLRYTFSLRAEARFGTPVSRTVTPADVRRGIERALLSGVGVARALRVIAGSAAFLSGQARTLAGVEESGSDVVAIRLVRPSAEFLSVLAHPQTAAVPAGTPPPGGVDARAIAGAGPYRIASYVPERRVVLARSSTWSREDDPVRGAWVDRVEIDVNAGRDSAVAAVAAGDADLLVDPGPPDDGPVPEPSGARVAVSPSTCVRYVFLNPRAAPFGSVRVRRAVRLAISGAVPTPRRATAAGGVLPPGVFGHSDRGPGHPDVAAARRALAAAGHPNGVRATLVVGSSARDRAEARALTRAVARAGMRITTKAVGPAVLYPLFYERVASRVQMGIATWCADWPGAAGGNVLTGATGPAGGLDAASSRETAAGSWARAAARVERSAVIIPLYWPAVVTLFGPRVSGHVASPMWPAGDPTALWIHG